MTLSYDSDADVLYISIVPAPQGSYVYAENENGDVLKLDKRTSKVVGVTVIGLRARVKIDLPSV